MTAPAGDALSHENLGRMRIADRTKISRARRPSFFETDSAAPNHAWRSAATPRFGPPDPFRPDLHGGHERNNPGQRSSFDHYLDTTSGNGR